MIMYIYILMLANRIRSAGSIDQPMLSYMGPFPIGILKGVVVIPLIFPKVP